MARDLASILGLEVPFIVVIGERSLKLSDVLSLVPGSMIELPKRSEEDLLIHINNKQIGKGQAVKVGENFGIRVTFVGDLAARIQALGGAVSGSGSDRIGDAPVSRAETEEILAGQV